MEREFITAAPCQLNSLLVTIIPTKERAHIVGQIEAGGFDFQRGPLSDAAVARLDEKLDAGQQIGRGVGREHPPGPREKSWQQASRRQRQHTGAGPLPSLGRRGALDQQNRSHGADFLRRQFDGSGHHPAANPRLIARQRFRYFNRREDPLLKTAFGSGLELQGNLPLGSVAQEGQAPPAKGEHTPSKK
jgi:hypothetical protein